MFVRSLAVSLGAHEVVARHMPFRSLLARVGVALLVSASCAVVGCTNGVGGTCEITEDCSGGLQCCSAGLMRGSCQTDCTGVIAPPDAFAAPDASSVEDAREETDAATPADAFDPPDAVQAADAAVDGGS